MSARSAAFWTAIRTPLGSNMSPDRGFWLALEACCDTGTLAAFADWLDDRDEEEDLVAGLRWMVSRGKRPYRAKANERFDAYGVLTNYHPNGAVWLREDMGIEDRHDIPECHRLYPCLFYQRVPRIACFASVEASIRWLAGQLAAVRKAVSDG